MERSDRIRVLYCIDNMRVGGAELNALRTAERAAYRRREAWQKRGAIGPRRRGVVSWETLSLLGENGQKPFLCSLIVHPSAADRNV